MKKYIIVILTIACGSSYAGDDNMLKAIEIIAHGNEFQAERIRIATENLANEYSTGDTPGSDPYRRKIIYGEDVYDPALKAYVLKVKKYTTDQSPLKFKFDPAHPAADAEGYVKLPNVDRNIEKADISEAQRSYEAGLGVIEISKSMIQRTLEVIGK